MGPARLYFAAAMELAQSESTLQSSVPPLRLWALQAAEATGAPPPHETSTRDARTASALSLLEEGKIQSVSMNGVPLFV